MCICLASATGLEGTQVLPKGKVLIWKPDNHSPMQDEIEEAVKHTALISEEGRMVVAFTERRDRIQTREDDEFDFGHVVIVQCGNIVWWVHRSS